MERTRTVQDEKRRLDSQTCRGGKQVEKLLGSNSGCCLRTEDDGRLHSQEPTGHSQAVGINPNEGTDDRGPAALSELSRPVAAVCLPLPQFLSKQLQQRSYSCPTITCRDRGGRQAVSSVHKCSNRTSRDTTHQAVLRESHPRSPTCSST